MKYISVSIYKLNSQKNATKQSNEQSSSQHLQQFECTPQWIPNFHYDKDSPYVQLILYLSE